MSIGIASLISKDSFKRFLKYTLIPFSIWGIASYISFQIGKYSQSLFGFLLFPVVCSLGPLIGIAGIIKSGNYKKGASFYWFYRIMIVLFAVMFILMVCAFTFITLELFKEE
jgi:hypothetical protein